MRGRCWYPSMGWMAGEVSQHRSPGSSPSQSFSGRVGLRKGTSPMASELPSTNEHADFVWGGVEIGRLLGVNRRKAFYLLERGHVVGAKKIGGSWCLDVARFRASFEEAA